VIFLADEFRENKKLILKCSMTPPRASREEWGEFKQKWIFVPLARLRLADSNESA
jgi:hypothetical protein